MVEKAGALFVPLAVIGGTAMMFVSLFWGGALSQTGLYCGLGLAAVAPLFHQLLVQQHREALVRELARVKATDLETMDERIATLNKLVKDWNAKHPELSKQVEELLPKLDEIVSKTRLTSHGR